LCAPIVIELQAHPGTDKYTILFPFTTTNLPEPPEEEMKTLMAIVMQNGLMIQQLQLMVALKQKEIEEEEQREENR